MTTDTREIDLQDVLKERVAAGKPVYVVGNPGRMAMDAVMQGAKQAADEVGKKARVVQVVDLSELPTATQPRD